MLGALALGDIGKHFPDSDERFKGIDSSILLANTAKLIREKGWQIGNIDATVIAQAPRLSRYIETMRENIATVLALPIDSISIKATTEEGLGFTGEGLGIATHAVCLLFRA
jgi:2-C-methyl-D-erythritol 2,4-cyclodiphosphate synthase